jgi:hypothetical protein
MGLLTPRRRRDNGEWMEARVSVDEGQKRFNMNKAPKTVADGLTEAAAITGRRTR